MKVAFWCLQVWVSLATTLHNYSYPQLENTQEKFKNCPYWDTVLHLPYEIS